jgi:hypothetical protein
LVNIVLHIRFLSSFHLILNSILAVITENLDVYLSPRECGSLLGNGRLTTSPSWDYNLLQRYNLKEGLCERSKLADHAFEEGHRVGWDQAEILEVECNSLCRKYKKTAHLACCNNPISQASVEMSPLWLPFIKKELL